MKLLSRSRRIARSAGQVVKNVNVWLRIGCPWPGFGNPGRAGRV